MEKESELKKVFKKKYADRKIFPDIESLENELFKEKIELKSISDYNFFTQLSLLTLIISISFNVLIGNLDGVLKLIFSILFLICLMGCAGIFVVIIIRRIFNLYEYANAKQELKIECIKAELVNRKGEVILNKLIKVKGQN